MPDRGGLDEEGWLAQRDGVVPLGANFLRIGISGRCYSRFGFRGGQRSVVAADVSSDCNRCTAMTEHCPPIFHALNATKKRPAESDSMGRLFKIQ